MKPMSRRLAVLVAAVALMGACASAAWAVEGTVTDARDKPIANARILAFADGRRDIKPAVLRTDSNGKFTYQPPRDGRYWYVIATDGYGYVAKQRNLDKPKTVEFKLWPAKEVTGRVVDSAGKGVPGAKISVRSFHASDADYKEITSLSLPDWMDPALAITTDKLGRFTLSHVPDVAGAQDSGLEVSVVAPSRALLSRNFRGPELDSEIKIIDPLGCSVSGVIQLPGKSGPAPRGLEVCALFQTPGVGQQNRTTTLDDKGRFSFPSLPAGQIDLMLTTQDRRGTEEGKELGPPREWALAAATELKVAPREARELELVMVRGALIKGKVVDKATGKPASGGRVNIEHAGRPEGEPDRAQIGKNGEFAIRVVPGKASITVEYCRFDKNYVSFDEGRNESPSIDLSMSDGDEKSDVVLSVDASSQSSENREAAEKMPPPDFQLKLGTYGLTWDPELDSTAQGYARGGCSGDKARAKMRKLPALKSKKPILMGMQLDGEGDDGLLLAVFDESHGTGSGYDTAYVDANRNRDLADDTPVKWRPKGSYYYAPWMTVQARQGAGADRMEHPIRLRWQMSSGRPMYTLRRGGWRGTLDSSKGPVQAIALDWNGNGLFNDRYACGDESNLCWQDYDWGDCVFADTNGYGRPMPSQWGPHTLVQGGVNVLGDKGYLVTVNSCGNKVTVAPYDGQMGKLLVRGEDINGLSGPVVFLNLIGKARIYDFRKLEGQSVSLPAGKYLLGYCSFELPAEKEKLSVGGSLDKVIDIKPGEQTTITVSGKPRLRLLPAKRSVVFQQGKEEQITWDISLGDCLKGVYINNRNEGVPKVKFDAGGFMALKAIGGG